MSDSCEHLKTCGFFKKYEDSKKGACRGFIDLYCCGEKRDACERKQYRKAHGTPPPDDMLPNGSIVTA